MADDTKPADGERTVDVIVNRFTSLGGQFLAPGRHRMRLSLAKHMQRQGLASPPPKNVNAVPAVEEEKKPEEEFEGE